MKISPAEVSFRVNGYVCHSLAALLSSEESVQIHQQLAAGYNRLVSCCLHGGAAMLCSICDVCDVMKRLLVHRHGAISTSPRCPTKYSRAAEWAMPIYTCVNCCGVLMAMFELCRM